MQEIFDHQQRLLGLIARSVENQKKQGKSRGSLDSRISLLDGYWQQFSDNDMELRRLGDKTLATSDYVTRDQFTVTQETYLQQRGELLDMQSGLTVGGSNVASAPAPGAVAAPGVQLPRVPIPRFSGSYSEWRSYHDLFDSLVRKNPALSSVQRMHYLKQSLSGDPERLIRNFGVTSDNFDSAWDTLCARYDNKRLLVSSHLSTLTAIAPIHKESAQEIKRVYDHTAEIRTALHNLKRPVDYWDDWLVHLTASKLDSVTRRDWERATSDQQDPVSWTLLSGFLEGKIRELEAVAPSSLAAPSTAPSTLKTGKPAKSRALHASRVKPLPCKLCKKTHFILQCPDFRGLSVTQRKTKVADHQLCANCLSSFHRLQECNSPKRCQVCQEAHHTLLHEDRHSGLTDSSATEARAVAHLASHPRERRVLLATARVRLQVASGRSTIVRALVDSGSELNFVFESVVQRLRAPRQPTRVRISGLGETETALARSTVTAVLHSLSGAPYSRPLEALVLPRLTSYKPPSCVRAEEWRHLQGLGLADPHASAAGIEAVLGAEVYADILLGKVKRGAPGTPVAQASRLGWLLSGAVSENSPGRLASVHSLHCVADPVADQLRRFWEVEELPSASPWTEEETACDAHYAATHKRGADGRYTVRLPLRDSPSVDMLGESAPIVRSSLLRLERRLDKNPSLREAYTLFLRDYEQQDHMVRGVGDRTDGRPQYFLPHHAVLKPTAAGSKVRVVFNASQASSTEVSLNAVLHTGPRLQRDLRDVLLRWRLHRVVFAADIEQMFRQIKVHPEDQPLQQILWRKGETQPINTYRLATVTYGTACAPYLAIRTLLQLADDEQTRFPRASEMLRCSTYVDDVLAGADSLDEARERQTELRHLLTAGGFNLRKWASNCAELLRDIAEKDRESLRTLRNRDELAAAMLGVRWAPKVDAFSFVLDPPVQARITKRIFSGVARIFDPLGWLSPVTIGAKIMLQELWLLGADWDQEVAPDIRVRWERFCEELSAISAISIPRWLGWSAASERVEIHGFCNASKRAYAAVAYLRVVQGEHHVTVRLMLAKCKVAPTKRVTLPRLELCGAHLLARLVATIRESLPAAPTYLWTDSTIVLAWLQGHPSRWKTFVANRVATIHEAVPGALWRHVLSENNPADVASRGLPPSELRQHCLWWSGPGWLGGSSEKWPTNFAPAGPPAMGEERRALATTGVLENPDEEWNLLLRISSYSRALRVVAYVLRVLRRHRPRTRALSAAELRQAKLALLRLAQRRFYREIHQLRRGAAINRRLTESADSVAPLPISGWVVARRCAAAPFLSVTGGEPSIHTSTGLSADGAAGVARPPDNSLRRCAAHPDDLAKGVLDPGGPQPGARYNPPLCHLRQT
ncbi:PREDICTED: uncharacterized protein LOC105460935 [Wasmannia auropunctata]|uniref:uncharacterized protein LOC105460935 n=1 Tax=Wasmannia auropunctata TaxID=64793 RepID=UPI0005EE2EB5|nr:PREDICTED: uncharacterized protein LOC105460935 [Wasmannia auropunctata]